VTQHLLEVENLVTEFRTEEGVARAVDGVDLRLRKREILGLVGESGCGKSVTALSVMRLIPHPPGRIAGGRILFDGRDLLRLSDEAMRNLRGNEISMIFQEPMTSLNPVFRVGDQIVEGIRVHRNVPRGDALREAVDMLGTVGIPSPERRVHDYPHQMSGGMRQRVMIAMALACRPKLLIADEPTTALDVTIQAQILDLMTDLRDRLDTSIMLITHDLGVIAEMAEQVVVMYAGRVVEEAGVKELFKNPGHPYTQGLLRSIPGLAAQEDRDRLETIPGVVPNLTRLPPGCKFNDRCPHAFDRCFVEEPALLDAGRAHRARCWLRA
jgi:peptide/nickel transport system ATP-binding protein/oligopeptide transport system ATP-binding protein